MRIIQRLTLAALLAAFSLTTAACEEQGPAERAGEAIDEAAEDVGDRFRELTEDEGALEKAGRKADEAIDEAAEEFDR